MAKDYSSCRFTIPFAALSEIIATILNRIVRTEMTQLLIESLGHLTSGTVGRV